MRALAIIVAVLAFGTVIAGGTVTSTGSGDDIPTWPFPIAAFGIEMNHRYVAGLTGLLTLALAGWMLVQEDRRWVRLFGVASAVLVVLQAGLGGVRILLGPAPEVPLAVTMSHAALGQIYFCVTVLTAIFIHPRWERPPVRRPAAVMTASIVLIQLLLGAYIRHAGALGSGLHVVPHLLWAAAVLASVLWMAQKLGSSPTMIAVLVLVMGQMFLGAGAYFVRQAGADASLARALIGTGHAAVGALILVLCLSLAFRPRLPADVGGDRSTRRAELVGVP